MALNDTRNLPVKTGGTGALTTGPVWVADLEGMEIQVAGTFTATLQLQGSLDGTNWKQIGSNITSAGLVAVTDNVQYLRFNTSAFTSGTPTACVAGRVRTENEVGAIEAKSTVATGAAFDVSGLTSVEVQIIGTGTFSLDIEGSLDGTHFKKLGSSQTAANLVAVTQECNYLHLKTTDATSPSGLKARVCGKPRKANVTRSLDVALVDDTAGGATNVEDLKSLVVYFDLGGGTNEVQIEGSLDGENFVKIGSDLTAAGFTTISPTVNYIRVVSSVFDTGTPSVTLIGREF